MAERILYAIRSGDEWYGRGTVNSEGWVSLEYARIFDSRHMASDEHHSAGWAESWNPGGGKWKDAKVVKLSVTMTESNDDH